MALRRHLITAAVGSLALAAGIALGAGPLGADAKPVAQDLTGTAPTTSGDVRAGSAAGDAFATSVAAALYHHGLAGHSIAILAMPGADPNTLAALRHEVARAGGSVTGTFQGTRSLLDSSQISLVDTLGSQLATQLPARMRTVVDPHAPTYPRLGSLLRVSMTDVGQASGTTATVRRSLVAADLLTTPGKDATAARSADLLLVVLGTDPSDADRPVLTGLVAGLTGQGAPRLVVTGPTGSTGLAAVHTTDSHAPTVEGDESAVGQVSAVLRAVHLLG